MVRELCALVLLFQLSACADEVAGNDVTPPPAQRSNALLRGRSNFVGVFSPSTATWKLKMQRPGWADEPATPDVVFNFGSAGDLPVVGDWNGDGTQTQGTWHDGTWSLSNTLRSSTIELSFVYGVAGDTPIVGDWDGDGRATAGLFRDGSFSLRNDNSAGSPDFNFRFGKPGDVPVVGDWDGDSVDTVGVYRASNASFLLLDRNQASAEVTTHSFPAQGTAQPVIGDWDESGESTIGLRSGRTWRLRDHNMLQWHFPSESTIGELVVDHGEAGDLPVVGNWIPDAHRGYVATPSVLGDFFPLAADFQPPESFQKWKDRGINTVIRVPVEADLEAWTAEANRLGLKMIRSARDNPANDNDETNLIAFKIKDEPEVDLVRQIPSDPYPGLVDIVAKLRAPGVTQRPVFMNFAGVFMLDPADQFRGPGDDGPDWYSRYLALEDWASQDAYPLGQMRARLHMDEQGAMDALPLAMDKLRRWAPTKPQFVYIESSQSDSHKDAPPLDRHQFRAQVWSAIVHGARGIFYFPHGACDLDCNLRDITPPDVAEEMTAQNARITGLAEVLQSAINPANFAVTAPYPLDAGWREYAGDRYAIVVNYSAQPQLRWIRIEGLSLPAEVEVLDESRAVQTFGGNAFEDDFEPYAVHIYRFR